MSELSSSREQVARKQPVEMEDPETRERLVVNTSKPDFRSAFKENADRAAAELDREFRRCQVDVIDVETGRPYTEPLMRFFQQRMRRFR